MEGQKLKYFERVEKTHTKENEKPKLEKRKAIEIEGIKKKKIKE